MDVIFSFLKYAFVGFFTLVGVLVVAALLFGKRIKKQWDFEAEFLDPSGREFGEFDIELSRIEKEEQDYSLKAKLRLRHAQLQPNKTVQVFLDSLLVLEGSVAETGRVFLDKSALQVNRVEASVGQLCRVVVGGVELCRAQLVLD